MKQKIHLAILLFLSCAFALTAQQKTDRIDFLISTLYDGGKSDYVMINAHRGDWRNAPENSIQAFRNCIDAGFDIIEIDVKMTKDSVIVIMHDETIDRTTTGKGKVEDYTYKELQQLNLVSAIRQMTRHKIPTFEEVLQLSKGNILIQVDKWQPIKEEVIRIAKKHGMLNHLILRGVYDSQTFNKEYRNLIKGVHYLPVLVCNGDESDNKQLDDFMNNIETSVMSFSFKKDNFPVLDRIPEVGKKGYRIWFNSMWADFNGGRDDEMAEYDLDNSYGWMLEKGANIIFTDRPFLLDSYLKSINRR